MTAHLFETLARLVHVGDCDSQMAETALHGQAVLRTRRVPVAGVVDQA